VAFIPESGHSSYWEQPELFNRAVLDHAGAVK
jgi:pimeloyl-ACP methyl ester carboxylesterase